MYVYLGLNVYRMWEVKTTVLITFFISKIQKCVKDYVADSSVDVPVILNASRRIICSNTIHLDYNIACEF